MSYGTQIQCVLLCASVLTRKHLQVIGPTAYLVTSITATVGDVATCVLVIHYFIQYSGETRIRGSLANTLLWDGVYTNP